MFHPPAGSYQADRSLILKEAMRRFVGAVCVVTTGEGEGRTGATVTSAHCVSMDPPTMLVSMNLSSSTYEAIQRNGIFCVNLLPADRREVAERFSGFGGHKGAERYEGADWFDLSVGSAALVDALAAIDCRVERIIPHGTHALILGAVRTVLIGDDRPGLLYGRGAYGSAPALGFL